MQLSLFFKKFVVTEFHDLFQNPLEAQKAEKKKNRSSGDALDFESTTFIEVKLSEKSRNAKSERDFSVVHRYKKKEKKSIKKPVHEKNTQVFVFVPFRA